MHISSNENVLENNRAFQLLNGNIAVSLQLNDTFKIVLEVLVKRITIATTLQLQ